ncbi:MAG: D-3-phosphoglycerate dehydrogenase [Chloroflexi bacterium]|nr:D-3-phosphoglycerate dehydrogenase [Chloroflexota bacterium]
MIGAEELALLPEQAVLVNVSRGPIVEQGPLYEALKTGKLYGAGLDVWYNYPHAEEERENTPPADYPFHELENVVMSPHRGGSTQATQRLRVTHLAKMLNAAANGEEMQNKIDLKRGY